MRIWSIVVSALLVASNVRGAVSDLPGHPFLVEKARIVWKAPTNNLPAKLWVYEEFPREFSTSVVSSVLALGELKATDKVRIPKSNPIRDKAMVRYQNKEKSRTLDIAPAFGWLEYRDTKAVLSTKEQGAIEGVPSPDQAKQLALQYINRLGIELSELAKNSNSPALKSRLSVGTRGWIDKASDKLIKETNTVGINFIRTLDGCSFAGGWAGGGTSIDFGNHEKVSRLSLSWRNLKRHKAYPTAAPEHMIELVKNGQSRMVGKPLDTSPIKTLTIKSVTPVYWGGIGFEQQKFIYPFAVLEVDADLGHSIVSFEVNCPIFADENSP